MYAHDTSRPPRTPRDCLPAVLVSALQEAVLLPPPILQYSTQGCRCGGATPGTARIHAPSSRTQTLHPHTRVACIMHLCSTMHDGAAKSVMFRQTSAADMPSIWARAWWAKPGPSQDTHNRQPPPLDRPPLRARRSIFKPCECWSEVACTRPMRKELTPRTPPSGSWRPACRGWRRWSL
jgi:hypothetical protein